MATSKQIKSAIRSSGASKRQFMGSAFEMKNFLEQADSSSKMYDLKSKQSEEKYNTIFSGLDLLSTISEGIEQKKELQSNIGEFEKSLGDNQKFRIEKKPNLMDVLTKKSSMTDYLAGDQYFVGDKSYGSKYDVSALGEASKSQRLSEEALRLSKSIENNSVIGDLNLEVPKVDSINGRPSELSPESMKYEGRGLETPKSVKTPIKQDPTNMVLTDDYMESRGMNIADPDKNPKKDLFSYVNNFNLDSLSDKEFEQYMEND